MKNKISRTAEIIAKRTLSSLVYTVEHNNRVDFIYFSKEPVDDEVVYNLESDAHNMLGCEVGIVDMRYFSEPDKFNLFEYGAVAYTENALIHQILKLRALEGLKLR